LDYANYSIITSLEILLKELESNHSKALMRKHASFYRIVGDVDLITIHYHHHTHEWVLLTILFVYPNCFITFVEHNLF